MTNLSAEIGRVCDQLSYNLLYAPNFPEEDETNLEKQRQILETRITQLMNSVSRKDAKGWLRLGGMAIVSAFEKFQVNQNGDARREIENAISYVTNVVNNKSCKATFISGPDGTTDAT